MCVRHEQPSTITWRVESLSAEKSYYIAPASCCLWRPRCEDTAGATDFREYGSSNGSVVKKIFRHDVMVMVMMMCAEDEPRREERRSGDLGG